MANKGFIETNSDRLDDFIRSIIKSFASYQIRLALWLMEEFDFGQLSVTQLNGPESPFSSGSQLAGSGYLITVESNALDTLINVLTDADQIDCNITHLELEVDRSIALKAYDTFEHVFFNTPITPTFLESLKQQAIIDDYSLFESPE